MTGANLEITDELLVAYVDGELDPFQRDVVSVALEDNPALRRRADEMRLSRDLLCEGFPVAADGGVPAPIDAAADRLAEACAQRSSPAPHPYLLSRWQKYALAAGVMLCVAGAATYLFRRSADPVTALMQISPGTPLHDVLESRASAEVLKIPGENAAIRAVLTFRAKDGRYCREFEILAGSKGATGIACRDHGEWHAEVMMSSAAFPPAENNYTPAGESDEPAVAAVADRLMQSDPLDAHDEARLLATQWGESDHP